MKNKLILLTVSGILILSLAGMTGCNSVENLSNSNTRLIVDFVTGTDLAGAEGATTVFSDVLINGSIINDNAMATLRAELINPLETVSTYYQELIVDQVDISYSRTDRPNAREGVDIPFGFSQKVNARVSVGQTTDLSFVVVQQTAKLESPLVELVNLGQEIVLRMEVHMTFYARDLADNRVTPVKASISIWFSNFADAEGGGGDGGGEG
ncbi:MAG: hypothetical protein GY950_07960 [bacterium]|nr:hypothetical protein [bacterium]